MRKNGGFIPGIRPGRSTSEYVSVILKRLTFIGAIYLAIVCILPEWMIAGIHFDHLPGGLARWFDRHFPVCVLHGLGVTFYFGGTSLLIVVGVAMDTVQQLEAQLVMRNYEGFARKGRAARPSLMKGGGNVALEQRPVGAVRSRRDFSRASGFGKRHPGESAGGQVSACRIFRRAICFARISRTARRSGLAKPIMARGELVPIRWC